MSLINKMLQDLDARGGARPGLAPDTVRAVPAASAAPPWPLAVGAVLALIALALALGGWYGWRYWQQHAAQRNAAKPAAALQVKMIQPAAPAMPVPPAPAMAVAVAPPAAPVAAPPAPPLQLSARLGDAGPASRHAGRARAARAASMPAPTDSAAPPSAGKPEKKPRKERTISAVTPAGAAQAMELAPDQLAENAYRRALAALQDGRVNEAMAGLDRVLELNPRHEAARQTLIDLLLENKRNDEAVHHLRLALGLNPAQPALAMLLARLQVESGGPAAETLLATLPYAADNAEYHALLGAVLQRAARHMEAAAQYQAALKLAPQNGVWWMGLGISLQADKQVAEAREAYRRAKASGGLNPELLAFVERRLQQLAN